MKKWQILISILHEARTYLALPGNNFFWSYWEDSATALSKLDELISLLEKGQLPAPLDLSILFAPTGPIQEVSLSSGWSDDFLKLAERFDRAMEAVYGSV